VKTAAFLRDLTRVRARTRKHVHDRGSDAADGATVVALLNDILASELIWLMRYRRRYLLWARQAESAGDEPTPADRVARRIVELGGRPDLDPDRLLSRTRSDYAARGSVGDRIREDLRAERIVIESYAEVIDYVGDSDASTREMLEENLRHERTRVAQLSEILRDVDAQAVRDTG
jgi:bacterioferritin